MLKLLEVSWLMIMLICLVIAAYQLVSDGWQSATWMIFVTAIALFMYSTRRRQRIRMEQHDGESARYH